MKTPYKFLLHATLMLLLPSAARAVSESVVELPTPTAGFSMPSFRTGSVVMIDATTKNSRASVALSNKLSDGNANTFSEWTVDISAPLSKDKSTAEVGTLDAFADAAKLTIGYNSFHVERAPTTRSQLKLLAAACKKLNITTQCDPDSVREKDPDALLGHDLRFWASKPAFFWGISGTIGHEDFDYRDVTNYSEQESSRTPWGLTGFLGLSPSSLPGAVLLGVEFQEGYKENEEKALCSAAPLGTVAACDIAVLGKPADQEKHLIFIEARSFIPGSSRLFGSDVAVSAKITTDVKNDEWGVDIPVHLLTDTSGKFAGGVKIGWESSDNDVVIGVFVGSEFNVF